MASDPLLQIIYGSAVSESIGHDDLVEILRVSRRNNAAAGVTGALLYADGNVIQALEGPASAVEATYQRIARDPRHRSVLPLLRGPVDARSFPDWAMGGILDPSALNEEERAATRSLIELTAGGPDRAQRLLASFRSLLPGVRASI